MKESDALKLKLTGGDKEFDGDPKGIIPPFFMLLGAQLRAMEVQGCKSRPEGCTQQLFPLYRQRILLTSAGIPAVRSIANEAVKRRPGLSDFN